MIELLLNRGDAYTFKRSMDWQGHGPVRDEMGTPDRNDVRLVLTVGQVCRFRQLLSFRPERFENPDGILRMLGTETSDKYEPHQSPS